MSLSPSAETHPHPRVAHHFANIEQQREIHLLGMWIFLASEILFFGGVFTAYAVMRFQTGDAFGLASQHLNEFLGGVNTAVLLTSSFTMALAVWASQTRQHRLLFIFLLSTLFFGSTFLVIKGYEWYIEYTEHLVPGPEFRPSLPHHGQADTKAGTTHSETEPVTGDAGRAMQLFFLFYFIITGLHALHMVVGLGVLTIQIILVARTSFGIDDYIPIELMGLYWHFVDVVWIFVFPLLYLLRH